MFSRPKCSFLVLKGDKRRGYKPSQSSVDESVGPVSLGRVCGEYSAGDKRPGRAAKYLPFAWLNEQFKRSGIEDGVTAANFHITSAGLVLLGLTRCSRDFTFPPQLVLLLEGASPDPPISCNSFTIKAFIKKQHHRKRRVFQQQELNTTS